MNPGGTGATTDSEDLDTSWCKDLDVKGKATCPKCGTMLSYGTSGVINLVKRHLDTPTCQASAAKKDKEPRRNASLSSFFHKLTTPVPRVLSRVRAPSPIRGSTASEQQPKTVPPPTVSLASSPSRPIQLLAQLQAAIKRLPSTIPFANENSPLAALAGVPAGYVSEGTPADELWEQLSAPFHRAFGYGTGVDARARLVERGPFGLDGTLRFFEYFIRERGLEGGPVELKLEQLVEAVQFVNPFVGTRMGISPMDVESESPTVIDVDAEVEKSDKKHTSASKRSKSKPCGGFFFPFSADGKNASSEYPYGLHDTLNPPWTYSSNADGTLTLRSTECTTAGSNERPTCAACASLRKDPILRGILERAKDGVDERANYAYHSVSGLIQLLRRKNKQIQELRVRGFNAVKRIAAQARSLTEHKRFVRAIGSGKVENVDRLVRVQLGRKQGIRGLIGTLDKAAEGLYHPKSYTEQDDLRGVLLWKLAGNRVADFAHRALGLPSRTTLRKRTTNVAACFEGIADVLAVKKPKHAVLMYDEIATERRIRWDSKTNNFLGVCREHGNKVSLQFNSERDLDELFQAKEEGKVHFAGEATVAAIGMLSDETRLYAARPVLISSDCKKESGVEHLQNVLDPTIAGINSKRDLTGLRIVSLASDGETRRGKAFIDKTFTHHLSPESNIYDLLKDFGFHGLPYHKHVIKRARNRLLRALGMRVFQVQITPPIIRLHLQHAGLSAQHISAMLSPEDKQNVNVAFNLLKDFWSLPPPSENLSPGFVAARDALHIIGSLFYHLLFPYLCVDLSLSEQLEHLSAAAYLLLILYRDGQKHAIPTLLYTDIMLMIKNVYFCVTKAKIDDPTGSFWLMLLGTDRLEELFGILRTMIGNDRNLDSLQLAERITGTTEIANIFAMYPHWDRPPRRLHLPAMAREDSTALPDRTDHIKPPSWRGDTSLVNLTPLTCWNRGRRLIEQEHPSLVKYLHALDKSYNVTILAPLGELIINKSLDVDDNEDEDEDDTVDTEELTEPTTKSAVSPDLEDAAIDEDILIDNIQPTFTKFITVQDQLLRKTRALSLMQKVGYQAASTDRLKRVADVQRHSKKSDEPSLIIDTDSPYILVSEPIVTLVRCEDKIFVCIGEVTDIWLDSKSVEQLSVNTLQERKVTVHFQILCLVPASTEDDPESKHDWRSRGVLREVLTTHGRLVLPVDPALSTRIPGKPYYLFESDVLRAFGAQLLGAVTSDLNKNIPKFTPSTSFPYREPSGLACFVCEGDNHIESFDETDLHMCTKCCPSVALDITHPQTVLTHIGAHILHDSTINRSDQPCGLCGRPSPMCSFVLKKTGEGFAIDFKKSQGCPNFIKKFNYNVAAKSGNKSPCSNVPLRCPECDSTQPTVWRYNLKYHLIDERDELSNHSDSSDTASTDSPIASPEPSDQDNDEFERPVSPVNNPAEHEQIHHPERRSLTPLEYISESEFPPTLIANTVPPLDLQAADTAMDAQADGEDPGADSIYMDPSIPSISYPTDSSPAAGTASTVIVNSTVRRSGRKRKEREDLGDISAALGACICGSSAAPVHDSDYPNVARCKKEGCETKWYHLRCLQVGSVGDKWVCDPCETLVEHSAGPSKRRRTGGK
ncbi:hypothetical protein B0H12DRAFT_1233167 [Mycena haematopus]|nr:hypothetical protein B0H12DRAFT_1233167 [Mycena haematopus]